MRMRPSRWPPEGLELIKVHANGIEFEVAAGGTGEVVALLLHGFPEHASTWRHQVPMLIELGYRVWAPNLRGYGETSAPASVSAYALSVLVADVDALVAAAGGRRTILVGHDWGGLLAWLVALRRPIERLVVLGMPQPDCFQRELRGWRQLLRSWYIAFFQIPLLPEIILTAGRASVALSLLGRMVGKAGPEPEFAATFRWNILRRGRARSMVNWYRGLRHRPGLSAFLGTFENKPTYPPTLMIWGEREFAFTPRVLDGTSSWVSDLTIVQIPGASHAMHRQFSREVNLALRAWLGAER
jgi:pimeloyl-ACP methyl ester carboxylesterase